MPRSSSGSHHRSGVTRQRVVADPQIPSHSTEDALSRHAETERKRPLRPYRRLLPEVLALSVALLAFCAGSFWRKYQTSPTRTRVRNEQQEWIRRPRAPDQPLTPTVSITSPAGRLSDEYVSFSIGDARAERSTAFFKTDPSTKLGIVFDAYSKLRNGNDSRCFFYNAGKATHPLDLVLASQTASEADIVNGSVIFAAAVADDSQVCGQGLKTLRKQFFLENTTEFARLARLFLGCAIADTAEPDWRRSVVVDDSPSLESLQNARPPPKKLSPAERALKVEAENPWRRAEVELREALRLGSRAARIALARLIVVSAHFETRPTFLEDARDILEGDDQAFAEAVATGTRLAARKASKLLATECASENADLDVVSTALAAGADIDAAFEDDGSTPLMLAARRGHAHIVSALLAAGADVEILDDHERTAAHFASDSATKEAFKAAGAKLLERRGTLTAVAGEDMPGETSSRRIQSGSPMCDVIQRFALFIFVLVLALRSLALLWEICRQAVKSLSKLPPPRATAVVIARYVVNSVICQKISDAVCKLSGSLHASFARRRPTREARPTEDAPSVVMTPRRSRDIANDVETLNVADLDVSTLERLDKLLPELQRSVVRELMAREAADNSRGSQNAGECVICLAAPRLVAFGCGHLCCCEKCADAVVECPVCRQHVSTRHRIFNTT